MRRVAAGIAVAVRRRPLAFFAIVLTVVALDVWLPPVLLSIARKPWTYFTFNPWLKRLPAYLVGPAPVADKLDFLTRVAVFWFSADGDYGAPEWGFAVDTLDLLRFVAMAVLVGLYVVLVLALRPTPGRVAPGGGVLGALASVVGLSTGPCSVVGCGAPVLPVVGLVFAGLSSGTLALLSRGSRLLTVVTFVALVASVVVLGWRVGEGRARAGRVVRAGVH